MLKEPKNQFPDHLTVITKVGGRTTHPSTHPPQERILTTFCSFVLQGADNEGGFLLRGRRTKVRLFYVKRAEISTLRLGEGRGAD